MRHQLHLHESPGTITPMMIHQPGAAIKVEIDLHLGQKPKLGGRPKIFPLFLSIWFFSFLPLVCFTCYFGLLFENPKIFCFVCYFLLLLFQESKTPKIFVVLLRFCKVCCRVQSLVTPLELGIHFILFKPHK
jgi:cellulose synthase/poly-beta-1,6-N-acetylglucosamine synthase-like glycosyltransferase